MRCWCIVLVVLEGHTMFERTSRWHVILSVAIGLVAVGLWTLTPALLMAAMIPLGYVAYSVVPSPVAVEEQLAVMRSVTPTQTHPGGAVTVELTVEHVGDKPLPDLRIVDGVPDPLPVIDGSPRAVLSLQPTDTATIEYTVRARSGTFGFSSARVRTTSLSGERTYTTTLTPDGETQIAAQLGVSDYPLSQQTTRMVGALATDRGGEGLEFYGTREYRAGDPASRINWRQYAETRELTTIDYQQQEAVEVVIIVDARAPAAVAASDTDPTGVELDAYAASEAVDGLLTARNRVGLVTLGVGNDTGGGFGWIPPGDGHELRSRIRTRLDAVAAVTQPGETVSTDGSGDDAKASASETAGSSTATGGETDESGSGGIATHELVDRLSPRTQVVLFSPLCDAPPVEIVQQLQAAGHTVSVCTPDVTSSSTAGSTLAGVDRGLRLATLRAAGATVIDWSPDESLAVVLERTATALAGNPISYS